MYEVSQEYKEAIKKPIQKYKLKVNVGQAPITEADIVAGSFQITNQCAETDIVQIGSVYAAKLNMTIDAGVVRRNTWKGARITASEGVLVETDPETGERFEFVPLGVFRVAEANHTDNGVQIEAYDDMLKFDKSFNLSTTIGSPFSILSLLCEDVGVSLGMTRAQVEALPNGSAQIALYTENDCKTYRDVLFWLAQLLACFAIIGRDGKLYLRQYTDQTVDEIGPALRFEGGSFSDFETEYSGVGFTDIDSQEYIYVTDGPDTKLSYNLGANPFMQYGTASTRKQQALNILNALKKIKYTPFRTEYLNTPAYDLGDVIEHPGGLGQGALGCIMLYEYKYEEGYAVEGFGQNPDLASAQSKTDKELAGLMSKTNKNEIQFYTFKNAERRIISNHETRQIIYIRFTTKEAKQVVFQGEILADVGVPSGTLRARVRYFLDGTEIEDYQPTETWDENGRHILSLYYVIDVEPNTLYRWEVRLEAEGGAIIIPVENARGTVWAQGLVATEKWDGYIDAEDTVGEIDIADDLSMLMFIDSAELDTITPEAAAPEETLGDIPISDDLAVEAFDDTAIINKTSIYYDGLAWGDLLEDTWGEVYDAHTW